MTLLQTWLDYVGNAKHQTEDGPEDERSQKFPGSSTPTDSLIYFASTSLDLRHTDSPDKHPQDIIIDDLCYRKVDPDYLAWLRRKMETAKRQFEMKRLPIATWEKLRGRFNQVQEWAIGYYGRESVEAAIRQFDFAKYVPPVNPQPEPYFYPATGEWKFSKQVTRRAIRKVDTIREAAMAKGWSEARLYQNRGQFRYPLGNDYGIVCSLKPNDEIGEITETYIELIHIDVAGRKSPLKFYNFDVFPPRLGKLESK